MKVIKRHQNLLKYNRCITFRKHASFVKAFRKLFTKQLGHDIEVIFVFKYFKNSHYTRMLDGLDYIDFLVEK